ncbi:MAG: hypothetical protein KGI97_01205 [Alphaproteobacteria bacterium]|nr:hypothetical protein [Alphaproteobacteria bacterium]
MRPLTKMPWEAMIFGAAAWAALIYGCIYIMGETAAPEQQATRPNVSVVAKPVPGKIASPQP